MTEAREQPERGAGYHEDTGSYQEAGYSQDAGYSRDAGYPRDAGYTRDAGYGADGFEDDDSDGYDSDDSDGYDSDGYDGYGYGSDGYGTGPTRRTGGHGRARPPRRFRPVRSALVGLLLLVVVVVLGIGVHFDREINPGGRPGPTVSVTIPEGASSAQIGTVLAAAGVIHGSDLFRYYVKLKGAGPLLPGAYHLARNEKYDAVISTLSAGPPQVDERLVIPEGYTLAQIAARVAALPTLGLSAAKFLAASSSGQVTSRFEPTGVHNLEGLVFPATYTIRQGMTEADVLQSLVARFDDIASTVGLVQGAAALGMTPYQVITVASIVEREAKLNGDRGPVASTIYNRLHQGMTLGADSTLVYALRLANPSVSISSIDYNQANPFNTRLDKGLPPTPIANPGIPSLTAAVTPPTTSYLYFVETNPDGQLSFASTSSGFTQLQAQCRAAHLC